MAYFGLEAEAREQAEATDAVDDVTQQLSADVVRRANAPPPRDPRQER